MSRTALHLLSVIGIAAIGLLGGVGSVQADTTVTAELCNGWRPTIVQVGGVVYGTSGHDVIVAARVTAVYGLAGDDVVCAAADAASAPLIIDAGSGNDLVYGCNPLDLMPRAEIICPAEILGGSGNDSLATADRIDGGSGNDQLMFFDYGYGGSGDDALTGQSPLVTVLCDGGSGIDQATECATVQSVP
jgi:hypothetical protein